MNEPTCSADRDEAFQLFIPVLNDDYTWTGVRVAWTGRQHDAALTTVSSSVGFSLASRDRLTDYDLGRFPGDTLRGRHLRLTEDVVGGWSWTQLVSNLVDSPAKKEDG